MIVLQEGQQYSLSTGDESNKSLIFVKLTDSALQSIEMYLKSKDDSVFKPTIQFQNNNGTISVPLNGRKHNYGFTLSNIEGGGLQGSFQCLQHTGGRSLEALGSLLMKMQIHAKEDSYEKTKYKMAAADQEQKSFCTKEIKQNGARLGRKFKVKRPGLVLSSDKIHSGIKKQEPTKLSVENKFTKSAVMHQPIRERVIHILAVNSYRKPELLFRLMKEGLNDKDKNSFSEVLADVGTLKGHTFNLANHLWSEVQENWEFCSKEELQIIQRRKQQFLKTNSGNAIPGSKTLTNSFVTQNGISSEPVIANKSLSKKQRLSHNGPEHINEIVRDDSSVPNSSCKFNHPSVGNSQKFPNSLKMNGVCNGTSQASKKNSVISCKQDFADSVKLRKCLEAKNSYDRTADPMETSSAIDCDKSSTLELSLPQKYSKKEANHWNSKAVCEEVVNNIDKHQNETSSLSLSNLVSISKHAGHGANSNCQVKESKSYGCTKTFTNTNMNGKNSFNRLSVLDSSKIYSPLSHSNSSVSSHKKSTEFLALHSSEWLRDKYYKKSKLLEPLHFIQPLPITCYSVQIGSDTETPLATDSASDFDCSETMQKYTRIESVEQRAQYVEDFNIQYEEYLQLHTHIKNVSEKFTTLFNHLHASVKGSIEFKKIKAEIAKEYKSTIRNSTYVPARKKYDFLKSKLSHIRQLILDYDNTHNSES